MLAFQREELWGMPSLALAAAEVAAKFALSIAAGLRAPCDYFPVPIPPLSVATSDAVARAVPFPPDGSFANDTDTNRVGCDSVALLTDKNVLHLVPLQSTEVEHETMIDSMPSVASTAALTMQPSTAEGDEDSAPPLLPAMTSKKPAFWVRRRQKDEWEAVTSPTKDSFRGRQLSSYLARQPRASQEELHSKTWKEVAKDFHSPTKPKKPPQPPTSLSKGAADQAETISKRVTVSKWDPTLQCVLMGHPGGQVTLLRIDVGSKEGLGQVSVGSNAWTTAVLHGPGLIPAAWQSTVDATPGLPKPSLNEAITSLCTLPSMRGLLRRGLLAELAWLQLSAGGKPGYFKQLREKQPSPTLTRHTRLTKSGPSLQAGGFQAPDIGIMIRSATQQDLAAPTAKPKIDSKGTPTAAAGTLQTVDLESCELQDIRQLPEVVESPVLSALCGGGGGAAGGGGWQMDSRISPVMLAGGTKQGKVVVWGFIALPAVTPPWLKEAKEREAREENGEEKAEQTTSWSNNLSGDRIQPIALHAVQAFDPPAAVVEVKTVLRRRSGGSSKLSSLRHGILDCEGDDVGSIAGCASDKPIKSGGAQWQWNWWSMGLQCEIVVASEFGEVKVRLSPAVPIAAAVLDLTMPLFCEFHTRYFPETT